MARGQAIVIGQELGQDDPQRMLVRCQHREPFKGARTHFDVELLVSKIPKESTEVIWLILNYELEAKFKWVNP